MQRLNAAPRDHLTSAYVARLLTGPSPVIRAGIRLLDQDDTFLEDISSDFLEGSVSRQNFAEIHGTCSVKISRELRWGIHRIQPYVEIRDVTVGPNPALFYQGVFIPLTPKYSYSKTPRIYDVTGYDKIYVLRRLIGDTWVAPVNAEYLDEVARVIQAAGETKIMLDSTARGKTLTKARVWPLIAPQQQDTTQPKNDNATFLQVANDLLSAIGYQNLWVDELGNFRSGPFIPAGSRTTEFKFSADTDDRIVGEEIEVTTDRFSAPNAWKFIRRNMPEGETPTLGNGIYVHENTSDGPTSVSELGRRNWRVEFMDAESHAALVAAGNKIIDADRRVETLIATNTGPFPALGHMDVFTYADNRYGGATKVLSRSWKLDLGTQDTAHQWEEV